MSSSIDRLYQLFLNDLPRAPGALALNAVLGWTLLLPLLRPDIPPSGALLPGLVILWQRLRHEDALRPPLLALALALLPLLSLLGRDLLPGLPDSLLTLPCAMALLPTVLRTLPTLSAGAPRPPMGMVLLPLLAPLILGCGLLLMPGQERPELLTTLLETLQIIAVLSAASLAVLTQGTAARPLRLLLLAKCFSTLALPWLLLHNWPDSAMVWLLAMGLLIEGEWESRLILELAREQG
ncbi:MAG: hypothetical protein H6678_08140 [Candidatus Delongbacteria bacterium]|nr:hypothetical protein [Candidatus Delongbacteria bacterium]